MTTHSGGLEGEFARGQLYQHRLRPEWGTGLFVGTIDGKPQLYFADGRLRGFLPSARASFVEAEPEPSEPAPRLAKPRKKAEQPEFRLAKPRKKSEQPPRVWTPHGEGGHSRKPPEVRDRIVELVGDRPRVELFAREDAERDDRWNAWGDELIAA